MVENLTNVLKKGIITVEREDTGEVLYRADNIITNISRWLFSMFMAATSPISLSPPQFEPISVAARATGLGRMGFGAGSGSGNLDRHSPRPRRQLRCHSSRKLPVSNSPASTSWTTR